LYPNAWVELLYRMTLLLVRTPAHASYTECQMYFNECRHKKKKQKQDKMMAYGGSLPASV
jgi:hypothetical protein